MKDPLKGKYPMNEKLMGVMWKQTKIDWVNVWKSFNHWFDWHAKDYTWETQYKKIEQIVEKQLSRRTK